MQGMLTHQLMTSQAIKPLKAAYYVTGMDQKVHRTGPMYYELLDKVWRGIINTFSIEIVGTHQMQYEHFLLSCIYSQEHSQDQPKTIITHICYSPS